MSYVIKSVEVKGESLKTVVEYTFADATKKEVVVYHFMPADKAVVLAGIDNRLTSEQTIINAEKNNQLIKIDLDKSISAEAPK